MKIKTDELTGPALDWAVAECQGIARVTESGFHTEHLNPSEQGAQTVLLPFPRCYSPSTRWSQGGPIIERERITVGYTGMGGMAEEHRQPEAYYIRTLFDAEEGWHQTGPTPLIAAMRCYVASELGDEVDVPEELNKGNQP